MLTLLKKYFGFDGFRPLQEEIVQHVVSGHDALVVMPTGSGKSLCYQLPALVLPGLTLVVSPLIALMKDQVDALQANGIAATFINSSLTPFEIDQILREAQSGKWKLLYVAPERLANPSFRQILRTLPVSLIAVDEAHCISEWGHDFRTDYRNLFQLRYVFPTVPWIALTATANVRVREDVQAQLRLQNGKLFLSSFNRPNLTYLVRPKKASFETLVQAITSIGESSAIIYCFSRKETERLALKLKARGFNALPYHAGLNDTLRRRTQEKFIRDECPIIVATIAFGMGIDKPNVRLVVHADLPRSVEGYYQETGRAGRDGLPSICLMLYSAGDRFKREYFIRRIEDQDEQARERQQLNQMIRFAETRTCRRKFLLEYFGEVFGETKCEGCDICLGEHALLAEVVSVGAKDVNHDLFQRLRILRRQLADARGVPAYIVASDRTLQEMAKFFPQSLDSLSAIHGIGTEKRKVFGAQFLAAIQQYLAETGAKEDLTQKEEDIVQTESVSDTLLATKALIEKKMPLADMARERGLEISTILNHIEKLVKQESMDITHLKPNAPRFEIIHRAFKQANGFALAPVRQRLGEDFSYEELRLARLFMK
ncbi:RecQ family ATP-dependent DNA helicase [Candidatus Uhrbacteria bacterium]|nr:RecQ family ATP-dependent DNA helicase [Candidatus Uhrbacteria bacterium]